MLGRTSKPVLTVDRVKPRTNVLGPGWRTVIWFHGCTRKCPGCIAAEMNRSQDFEIYEPDALLNLVLSRTDVEGVTLSGGEPFQQSSEALEMFLSGIKNRSNLSVMVYTGGLKEDLEQDPASRDLLKYVDLLVDGPYVESLDQGQLWRGSANQRFHFLTTRYADLAPWLNEKKGRPLEVEFLTGVDFALTGIPPKDFKEKLAQSLDRKGMTINL